MRNGLVSVGQLFPLLVLPVTRPGLSFEPLQCKRHSTDNLRRCCWLPVGHQRIAVQQSRCIVAIACCPGAMHDSVRVRIIASCEPDRCQSSRRCGMLGRLQCFEQARFCSAQVCPAAHLVHLQFCKALGIIQIQLCTSLRDRSLVRIPGGHRVSLGEGQQQAQAEAKRGQPVPGRGCSGDANLCQRRLALLFGDARGELSPRSRRRSEQNPCRHEKEQNAPAAIQDIVNEAVDDQGSQRRNAGLHDQSKPATGDLSPAHKLRHTVPPKHQQGHQGHAALLCKQIHKDVVTVDDVPNVDP